MKARITVALLDGQPCAGWLTTEHPASSYGLPVVVVDGEAYGPADVLWVDGSDAARSAAARARYPLRELETLWPAA